MSVEAEVFEQAKKRARRKGFLFALFLIFLVFAILTALNSFLELQINLPTDDLIRVIISKTFSDKQIKITSKHLEFIIKNIDRSYDKIFKFAKDIDNISLSTGKSININLIKKVLIDE